jgi:hypothetical protein
MHAAISAESIPVPPRAPSGPRQATPRAKHLLAALRPFHTATRWLAVLLAAWLVAWVGPDGWDRYAHAALGVSFGGLLAGRLPLPRNADLSLVWCMTVCLVSAMAPELDLSGTRPSGWVVFGWVIAGLTMISATIVAFCTAMREIARASGLHESTKQWRRVLHWQLGAVGTVILVAIVTAPQAVQTSPDHYEVESAWALALLGMALVAVSYPILALVRLLLHLHRSFGLRAMVERGDLVLRNDPSSRAPAPAPLTYQAPPPPWESSVAPIALEHPSRPRS